ncbi:MAG: class I SAM-dependent methyltransferase [Deltaproteobacteria bacterium]|nr:class I SAM-dependent methyltransferase [Deltaproteobacteria bacterium]
MQRLYKYFLDGVPEYLARYYWWAYLWSVGAWFFDHQTIINAVLFGQYRNLMEGTLKLLKARAPGRMLQLACVYGKLTPELASTLQIARLHLADISTLQLNISRSKVANGALAPVRMNAEALAYRDGAFDTLLIFFLLHEMPGEARRNTLSEAMRVISDRGHIIITEYGQSPRKNLLYRFPVSRWVLGRLEPFLPGFWGEELEGSLIEAASLHNKRVNRVNDAVPVFNGFYRIAEYEVLGA